MNRIIFFVLSIFVLTAHLSALPAATQANGNRTQFEREKIDFIKQSYSKIYISTVIEFKALVTKAVKELATSQNQTAKLQTELQHMNELLTNLEKTDISATQTISKALLEKVKPLLSLMHKFSRSKQQKTAEEQLISDSFDKYEREALEKKMEAKYGDFFRQVIEQLQSHFGALTEEESVKERDLYNLYKDLTNGRFINFTELLLSSDN